MEQQFTYKDYGIVRVYRPLYKNAYRYYIVSTAELDNLEMVILKAFTHHIGA